MTDNLPWATTALLRPNAVPSVTCSVSSPSCIVTRRQSTPPIVATLELHDPLRIGATQQGAREVAIHRDLSAPMAHLKSTVDRGWLSAFLQPGTSRQQSALRMLEPYQPGKIPVVFVHGLLSDPATWLNVANELRAVPWAVQRYQIWAYRYPTGEPFLESAAKFRQLLHEVVVTCDPAGTDKALRQMVLVGHSMGGLISKLQVTSSESTLWDAVANQPLDGIRADAQARERLRSLFFFEPHPSVTRVVFVGTPHRGSSWARGTIGRLGSRLVEEPAEEVASHDALIRDNPGVFSPETQRRVPTSVDLLETDSLILQAIERLQVNPRVKMHSVIGTGRPMLGSGPADGIVPVSSARHAGVVSERYVDARHSQLNSHPDTMSELLCILRQHVAEVDGR